MYSVVSALSPETSHPVERFAHTSAERDIPPTCPLFTQALKLLAPRGYDVMVPPPEALYFGTMTQHPLVFTVSRHPVFVYYDTAFPRVYRFFRDFEAMRRSCVSTGCDPPGDTTHRIWGEASTP